MTTVDRAEYMRAWRARNLDSYERSRQRNAALRRAQSRLGQRHPEELQELLAEELRRGE